MSNSRSIRISTFGGLAVKSRGDNHQKLMTKSKTNNGLADAEKLLEERQDRCRPRQNAGATPGFFAQSQYVETIFIPGIAKCFRRHTTRLFHREAIGAVPHSWQVTAPERRSAAQAGRWLASMRRAIVQVTILALWLA
jgi:hypothetical protein